MRRKRSGKMKIVLLLLAMVLLSAAIGLRGGKGTASLGWVELSQAQAELLEPGHAGTYTEWYTYTAEEATQKLCVRLYTLDLSSGQWSLLREGEIQLAETAGMVGFSFDQEGKLWAAVYSPENALLAQLNAEEKALPAEERSLIWWKKQMVDMKEGDEVTLAVQSLVDSGAQPIDPREAADEKALQNRDGLRAAFALRVEYTE